MSRLIIIAIMACAAIVLSCSPPDDAPSQADATPAPTQPDAAPAAEPPAPAPGHGMGGAQNNVIRNRGRVVSAVVAGGYSYLELEVRGGRVWLATKPVEVQPGDEIGWGDFAPMNNFTSKALDKTFDQILFVSNVVPLSEQAPVSSEGLVVSVQAAGGYSYIEVEREGGNLWLAAPEISLDAGDRIQWHKGSPMRDFVSKSLGRTFAEIYFTGGVSRVE